MVGRHLAVAILLFGCLVWRGTASHDEDSATKHLDELFEMISNDLAENNVCLDMELPRDCSITADCLKITCKEKFVGKNTVVTVNLNRCDEPVTVSINVEVKEEGIDWTHVFTSGDELSVPGWSFDLHGVGKAGLFVKVLLEPEDDELTLKVFLEGGAKVGSASVVPLKVEVVSQKMSISTEYCGPMKVPMKVRDVNIQGSTEVQMRQEALKDPKPLHNMSSSYKGVSRFSRTSQRDFIKANQSLKALIEI